MLEFIKLQEETPAQVFSSEICEIIKNIYFEKRLRTTICGSFIALNSTPITSSHFFKF